MGVGVCGREGVRRLYFLISNNNESNLYCELFTFKFSDVPWCDVLLFCVADFFSAAWVPCVSPDQLFRAHKSYLEMHLKNIYMNVDTCLRNFAQLQHAIHHLALENIIPDVVEWHLLFENLHTKAMVFRSFNQTRNVVCALNYLKCLPSGPQCDEIRTLALLQPRRLQCIEWIIQIVWQSFADDDISENDAHCLNKFLAR